MAKQWISGAIQRPGSLKREAKSEGKTLDELCSQGNLTGKTAKRCALRKTLRSFKK